MRKKECVAMLLAGGEGRRLGLLTNKLAKPAVHFGGKYRIIDFTLSNCTNSGIDTVGVLTQYQPLVLNTYIGIGTPWDLDRKNGGVTVLPPYMEQSGGDWYKGTANAIYRNISFVEQYDPEYVLVISGDHIYKMDYDVMLDFHKRRGADVTIAVIEVKWEEASRFGIMSADEDQCIIEFVEKPEEPKSNLASMGIYIFNWQVLKEYLIKDEADTGSSKDFGKDVIPAMLRDNLRMMAYPFAGYWKDVGTVQSLWEANMDLLENEPEFNLNDREWRIYSVNPLQPGQYVAPTAQIRRSLVNEGCCVFGEVDHSVLFYGVEIGEGSLIKDSVIMPNVKIGNNVKIYKSIIGEGTLVEDGCVIGQPQEEGDQDIILIGSNERIRMTTSSVRGDFA
ncbi:MULTISPECIES: glucose-1-phosphate adenylyltransferase [Paenibacillus]|uniref:Glucose-1-phosphate adenylyltransferase n=1 Tax=Paenibacillus naphthalenovorans TaxID=162209 RepID=A0A0U2UKY5_9BACL|nr:MULTISPECIES: glucose-1-phosphate adenylyltransferase [Paenibacillus]ALS22609.1 glucose-1-phosphate adenylyltransferase [Paenibacillus naphthalenovorans]GCL70405.1 glucose-1-phosphate adenylyltransferase [Paenibacillus naphthalenovorans]